MTMSRDQLARVIDLGRSSSLDCLSMLKDIRQSTITAKAQDPRAQLFATPVLNEGIFLKSVEAIDAVGRVHYSINTLIYFPYNHENIYEGGDSVKLDDLALRAKILAKTGREFEDANGNAEFDTDQPILEMIAALPTFDPFLLKSKAEQRELEDRIHPAFFNVSEEEWQVLRDKIRNKIRALVMRALQQSGEPEFDGVNQRVNIFLNKIWQARNVDGIEDLVLSLGIPLEKAPDLFFAWKAICYYQTQFEFIQPNLRSFFGWMGDKELSLPSDFAVLPADIRENILFTLDALRQTLKRRHEDTLQVLKEYETSYRRFTDEGEPEAFMAFLVNADIHCVQLAAGLASHTHAINLLYELTTKWGNQLKSRPYLEFLDSMKSIYDITVAPPKRVLPKNKVSMIKPIGNWTARANS